MMSIDTSTARSTKHYSQPVEDIQFGKVFTDNFFLAKFRDGRWQEACICPLDTFSLHPGAIVLHYAQAIFEGLKAFRQSEKGNRIVLFRPDMNAKRFNASAARLAIPPIEESDFITALTTLVANEASWVPDAPGSLYLRPAIIASEPSIQVGKASEYLFYVLALPAGAYFAGVGKAAPSVKVLVSHTVSRAAPGGTGAAKTGSNYAGTLQITARAKELGCSQVLFLDPLCSDLVEELGGMNIFFVREDKLLTPPLKGTILPGVTRNSVLQLAKDLEIPCQEVDISIEQAVKDIRDGIITEAFACGTAAAITSISNLVFENGENIQIGGGEVGDITNKMHDLLLNIQYGRTKDIHRWIHPIP